jgi:hypothetical protein
MKPEGNCNKPISIIGLITAILGLITAILILYQSFQNTKTLSNITEDIKKDKLWKSLTINAPYNNDTIRESSFEMYGSLISPIPVDSKLFVFARKEGNFFLIAPPVNYISSLNTWSQQNIQLGITGQWELHVCLADKKGTEILEKKIATNDLSGISQLPDGVEIIKFIKIIKE